MDVKSNCWAKKGFIFSLIILMLLNIIVIFSIFSMKKTLDKNQNIKIEIPDRLHNKITSVVESNSKKISTDSLKLHERTLSDLENKLNTQNRIFKEKIQKLSTNTENDLQKQQQSLSKQLKEIQKAEKIFIKSAQSYPLKIENIHKKTADQIYKNAEKIISKYFDTNYFNATINKIIKSFESIQNEFVDLNKNINVVVNNYNNNIEEAKKAFELSKSFLHSGNIEMAKLYALNAINHDSSNILYINLYNDIIIHKNNLKISDIDQFINILDLSVIQVPANIVSNILNIKKDLLIKRDKIVEKNAHKINIEIAKQIKKNIFDLEKGSLSLQNIINNNIVNEELLKSRIDTLNSIIADTSLNNDQRIKFTNALQSTTGIYSIYTTLKAAQKTLDKALSIINKIYISQNYSEYNIAIARNQLQTANSLLAQVWTSDESVYSYFISSAHEINIAIHNANKKLNIITSEPYVKEINNIISQCEYYHSQYESSYSTRIENMQKIAQKLPFLFSQIQDEKTKKDLMLKANNIPELIKELSAARYKAYQTWALEQLNSARLEYDSYNVITDNRAKSMFKKYILDINPTLLLSDVNSLYNSIYQLIYKELPNKAEMQYLKATYEQVKKLEDF